MKAIDFDDASDKRMSWLDLTGGPVDGGLTVLDYFAGKALNALILAYAEETGDDVATVPEIAVLSYKFASHMLAERNKRFTPQGTVQGVTGKTYG